MVFLSKVTQFAVKETKKVRNYVRNAFIDSLRLHVKSGNGGNGFPKYGGVGGKGGDVYVVATEEETLTGVIKKWPTKRIAAGHGTNSHENYILGPPGESVRIELPVGVAILKETGELIGELNEPGDELLVAYGGNGGSHKNGFLGVRGKAHIINCDLKLIADVGLVGFPNAGKSTLLKAVSKAKPKIANYPFTTIRPNVGIIEYRDFRQISVADLPGLIEGAHVNIGMGHKFLKHVERTKLLLLVVDINGFQLSPRHTPRSCLDTIVLLNKELELYKPELVTKPAMIILNKMDTDGAEAKYEAVKDKLQHLQEVVNDYPSELRPERNLVFDEVIAMSVRAGGQGIEYLKDRLRATLDVHAEEVASVQQEKNAQLLKESRAELKERGPVLV